MAGLTKECCTLPPVQSNYTCKGIETKLGDLIIYETGNLKSTKVLICVYDIFAFHPNIKQVCDTLGSTNEWHIVMPNFFRDGSPWNKDTFPPSDFQVLYDWLDEVGNWKKSIKSDVENVMEHYKKNSGASDFGLFGFCWGGKISILAGCDLPGIKGVGLVHSSFNEMVDAENVKCPIFYLPSQNEPDLLPFYNKVKERLGEDSAQHHRFDDMVHGFAAGRGDFNNPANRERVDELIQYLNTFFKKHFAK